MEPNMYNASLVASHLAGHLSGRIIIANREKDYDTTISHLKALIRAFTGNEFNTACHEWLREWNTQLEIYENLQLRNA